MKSSSQFTIILLATFLVINNSCKKGRLDGYNAIITGFDLRMCACCGGLMINFDGETKAYNGDFKLIDNAVDLGISENDKFPVFARVEWTPDTTNICNYIIITKFERQ